MSESSPKLIKEAIESIVVTPIFNINEKRFHFYPAKQQEAHVLLVESYYRLQNALINLGYYYDDDSKTLVEGKHEEFPTNFIFK